MACVPTRASFASLRGPTRTLQGATQCDLHQRNPQNCDRQNSEIHFASTPACDRAAVTRFPVFVFSFLIFATRNVNCLDVTRFRTSITTHCRIYFPSITF